MRFLQSSIVTIIVAFVLLMAYCQADPVPPPGTQASQGATTTAGQGLNPKLEECEKGCKKKWGSISKQHECEDECLWTYANDPQQADNTVQGQPNPKLQECEQGCQSRGSQGRQNQCKDECLFTYGG